MLGTQILYDSGYDPIYMEKFFEKLGGYFNKHFGPDWVEKDKFFKEFKQEMLAQETAKAK